MHLQRKLYSYTMIEITTMNAYCHIIIMSPCMRFPTMYIVCATSNASDQPAHRRRLIRAFASHSSIL